jgi:hydroxymethylpyrimidine pyrophosphatase-like HAD family hydrolase
MPPIDLVVTDLDGTLWHTDDDIDPGVVAAMVELERRGVPLLVATGRRTESARGPLARVGQAPPAVVLNGALGLDLATGERFHRAPFPSAQASAALAAFTSVGLEPVMYVDHPRFDVFLSATPSTHPDHVRSLGATAGVDDLARVAAEEAVLGFSMIGVPHRDGVAASEALGDLVEVHLDRAFDFAGLASLTAAPKGQSKWDGVAAFCAERGLDSSRVLALADGPNDIELLTNAAVGLVPAEAHPAALDLADHVIPAARDAGWTAVLDHLH